MTQSEMPNTTPTGLNAKTEAEFASLQEALNHITEPDPITGRRLSRAYFQSGNGVRMHLTSGISAIH